MVDIPDKDLLAPGHRGCAGCGASIGVKLALNALGENTVAISATGCLEVMTTPYPESAWEVPFIHVAFENSGYWFTIPFRSYGKRTQHALHLLR